MAQSEQSKWRKFLQPVVAGLALFLAAATAAVNKTSSDNTNARFTAIEIRHDNLQERVFESEKERAKDRETLANIRSDVAFIRGLLESRRK